MKLKIMSLLVAITISVGGLALSAPASAAVSRPAAGGSSSCNLMDIITPNLGQAKQSLTKWSAQKHAWVGVAIAAHSHVVQHGESIALVPHKGEKLVKGAGNLNYVRYVPGQTESSLFLGWNGKSAKLTIHMSLDTGAPRLTYGLAQAFLCFRMAGPLPSYG